MDNTDILQNMKRCKCLAINQMLSVANPLINRYFLDKDKDDPGGVNMSVKQMKDAIAAVYPGDAWKQKCNNMSDYQIIAIYYRFLEKKMFDKDITKERCECQETKNKFEPYQMDMFDILGIN